MNSQQSPDPGAGGGDFGADVLRAAVLRSWRDSPTRFTEDTNAEHDLRVGGYRDRLFTELAQNAADAAAAAGVPGRIRVSVVDGELRVANTGAALDAVGVASLASLRASAKPDEAVGRFGVGFAAVLAVTSAPRIVSRTGGVAFSEDRTRAETGERETVPVLRLPWALPEDEPKPPEGFTTEVRLPLRSDIDSASLMRLIASEVTDLLLALPWLAEVEADGAVWTRTAEADFVTLTQPEGLPTRWLTHRGDHAVWAVPVPEDGVPRPLTEDVLHTPTPTDERLSLPARLFASVPVEPSRRRVLAGPATKAAFEAAAGEYPRLLRLIGDEHRIALVPRAAFPLSEVDTLLRELIAERLAADPWLPAASGGAELRGASAKVLDIDLPELPALLADVVTGLVAAPLCGHGATRTLAAAGAAPIGVAEVVDAVTGIERAPSWWHALYSVLLDGVEQHLIALDELGALPVPLADGRTVPGPRGALLTQDTPMPPGFAELTIPGLHLVHADAVHPLLRRLGAREAGPAELLAAPAVRDAIDRSVDDAMSGADVLPLARAVLGLASGVSGDDIGALALPSRDGWRRADELIMPGSPLLDIFDEEVIGAECPFDVLDEDFAAEWPGDVLTSAGVLDTFAVVADEDPAGPDHELPDEDEWWDSLAEPPSRVLAVRDLDLVADDAWPEAVRLLAANPETWNALAQPGGHTRWWLARAALLADAPPSSWRLNGTDDLAGLYDEVPDVGLSARLLELLGVRTGLSLAGAEDAQDLCDRLADHERTVSPGLVLRAHAALAADPGLAGELDPPRRVRALDGSVTDADDAVVLDAPWLLAVWPADRLVAVAEWEAAPALADVFALSLAGDETTAEVTSEGEFVAWRELPAVVAAAALLDLELPHDGVVVHEGLSVGERPVPWWFDGELHADDTAEGLARAFAWSAGRWPDRLLVAALLDDPDPRTVLG
ncbi:molecular chaperone Hsp90 [Saccharomonospora sp. NPDC006951]